MVSLYKHNVQEMRQWAAELTIYSVFLHRTQHPIDFPSWCEARYDSQTCHISVVQKANPNLPCVHSADYEWGSAGTSEPTSESIYPTHLGR